MTGRFELGGCYAGRASLLGRLGAGTRDAARRSNESRVGVVRCNHHHPCVPHLEMYCALAS
jgi:hypothetical protein